MTLVAQVTETFLFVLKFIQHLLEEGWLHARPVPGGPWGFKINMRWE